MTKSSHTHGNTKKNGPKARRKKNLLVDHPAWAERLSEEWDYKKNEEMGVNPEEVTAGSGKKVWWKCSSEHEWQSMITSRTRGYGCPYCSGQRVLPGFNDLATTDPNISEEWHPSKNGGLAPTNVARGSSKKVWWKCSSGHEWQAVISNRTNGSGCPYCSGQRVLPGFSDLATTDPEIADEWHPTRNSDLTPRDVTRGSDKKVWWECRRGHEWQTKIRTRSGGAGCPYCARRYPSISDGASLASTMPELALQWHPTKNGDLTPRDVTKGSTKKVWWVCEHDHEWQSVIESRADGSGCPYCSGKRPMAGETDLSTVMPELASQWHPTKNGDLTPHDVTKGSSKKVWWKCSSGHEWRAKVSNRALGRSCPYCSGKRPMAGETDLATAMPELASQWHPTKNGDLTPRDVTKGSSKKVWWRCSSGHEWKTSIGNRSQGCGCPECASSRGEKDSVAWAQSAGFVVTQQWRHPNCRDKNPLPFDMMLYAKTGTALLEIALIEYDGAQHANETAYFNMKNLTTGHGFDYIKRHDAIKDAFCKATGRTLIRIPHTIVGVDAIGYCIKAELRKHGFGWWFDEGFADEKDAA